MNRTPEPATSRCQQTCGSLSEISQFNAVSNLRRGNVNVEFHRGVITARLCKSYIIITVIIMVVRIYTNCWFSFQKYHCPVCWVKSTSWNKNKICTFIQARTHKQLDIATRDRQSPLHRHVRVLAVVYIYYITNQDHLGICQQQWTIKAFLFLQ